MTIRTLMIPAALGLTAALVGCEERQLEEEQAQLEQQQLEEGQAEQQRIERDEEQLRQQEQLEREQRQQAARQPGAAEERQAVVGTTLVVATIEPLAEPTQIRSQRELEPTLQALERELRTQQMEVAGRVPLKAPQEQAAKGGEQATTAPSRGEMILFADPDALEQAGAQPTQALQIPTAILVYEDRGGEVFVAYREGGEQNIARIVEAATGAEQTAAKEGEPQQTQAQQMQQPEQPQAEQGQQQPRIEIEGFEPLEEARKADPHH